MNRGMITKKGLSKVTNVSFRVLIVLGILGLLYIMWSIVEFGIDEKNNSCLLGIENAFEEDQYVYANVDMISGKIAAFNYFDSCDIRIGIEENGTAVVILSDSEKMLDAMNKKSLEKQGGSFTIYGYSAKLPNFLKKSVINALNEIIEYEEVNEENIASYIGDYYLVVGESLKYFIFIIDEIFRIIICIGVISVGVILQLGTYRLKGANRNYDGVVGVIFGTLLGGAVWILNDMMRYDSFLVIFPCLCGYLAYWIFMEKNTIKAAVTAHVISNILMILCCVFIEFQRFYISINNLMPGHFSVLDISIVFMKNIFNGQISHTVLTHVLSAIVVNVTVGFVIDVCAYIDTHMRELLHVLRIDEDNYEDIN